MYYNCIIKRVHKCVIYVAIGKAVLVLNQPSGKKANSLQHDMIVIVYIVVGCHF
jgi:hypothetical protein